MGLHAGVYRREGWRVPLSGVLQELRLCSKALDMTQVSTLVMLHVHYWCSQLVQHHRFLLLLSMSDPSASSQAMGLT